MISPVKVFKLGGAALESVSVISGIINAVKESISSGNCLFIHGGGGEITRCLNKFGIKASFAAGQRITDAEAVKVVEMVLSGRINKLIVSTLNSAGFKSAGISGRDGGFSTAEILDDKLGYVGEITKVDITLTDALMKNNFIPVLSPVSESPSGVVLNVNADFFAAAAAAAYKAEELNIITSTGGVLDEGKLLSRIKVSDVESVIRSGIVSEGMIPKLIASKKAIEGGVKRVNMIDFKGKKGTVII